MRKILLISGPANGREVEVPDALTGTFFVPVPNLREIVRDPLSPEDAKKPIQTAVYRIDGDYGFWLETRSEGRVVNSVWGVKDA